MVASRSLHRLDRVLPRPKNRAGRCVISFGVISRENLVRTRNRDIQEPRAAALHRLHPSPASYPLGQ